MKEVISTEGAPKAIGPYSQAIRAGGFIFTSGQVAIDPATQLVIAVDAAAQTDRVLRESCGHPTSCRQRAREGGAVHRIPEEHGRLRRDERGLCAALHAGSAGALDRGSGTASEGCSGRDRCHCDGLRRRARQ